jgi:segregation and condensation protein B
MTDSTKKLQALIFMSAQPISKKSICKSLEITPKELDDSVLELKKYTTGTGVELIDDSDSLQLAAKSSLLPKNHQDILATGNLSSSALEVLAIIAYRQPISRQDIEEIRGISANQSLRGLIEKELIVEKRHKKDGINYVEYMTDMSFLRYMGIKSLAELPSFEAKS